VRGYRSGLLTSSQYLNLTQCDTLDDLKLQLSATEYGNFLANVPSPLSTSNFQEKTFNKLIDEFKYIRAQAVEPMSKFLDFITYGYMIDNVMLLITGTVHERDKNEILERCHPLGWFETLPALSVATDVESLYDTVLVDTPLAPYFKDCLSADELDDLNIEIIRNKLYRLYLKDFYDFCQTLPSPSNEVMSRLLEFEADRRTINISLNSIGTDLTKDERLGLMPEFGTLFPTATELLSKAEDGEQVRIAVESYGGYTFSSIFDNSNHRSIEDHFYQREMELCKGAFTQQFTYSTIWAWIKTREQEIRNITWIAECIAQNQKDRISGYISVF
jgi:V-type H+-transporting ATPase subunit d